MPERTNRRDLIVETAGKFFIHKGYEATSVRQIAECAGVTEAALYYHFKEGKRELLDAVFECHLSGMNSILDNCRQAASAGDVIQRYITELAKQAPKRINIMRWLLAEFSNLGEKQQASVHNNMLFLHDGLAEIFGQFIPDQPQASQLAWMVICVSFGYGQLFWSLNLKSISDFDLQSLVENLTKAVDQP